MASISLDTSEYEHNLDNANGKTQNFGSSSEKAFRDIAKTATVAFAAATAAVAAFAKASIDTGMQFDSSMSQVAATMGTTVDQIQDLRDFAMEMGATTAFSATQAADALNYMALAGYDAETSMSMLPTVLDLAAAGSIELASASDMVTDAQSALGLSIEETAEMVDKMAMASSKSNTSVAQLGEAILTVGGTAKMLAGGTTELSTALGILADNGIKGAEGGTHLRNVLLTLSAPTDTAAAKLKNLGIEAFDADGNMRPLNETLGDLNAAMADMSDAARANAISTIFNTTDISAVNALLANTGERWDELAGYIDDAAGAAGRMADTQLDNLAGDITLMQSAIEGVQIALSDKLTPSLRGAVQFFTDLAGKAQEFIEDGGLDEMVRIFLNLAPAIVAATTAFAAYKSAIAISAIVDKLKIAIAALNTTMSVNPAMLIATGIGLLAGGIVALCTRMKSAVSETQKFTESLNESKEAYDNLLESIGEERDNTASTAATLKELLAVEDKSAAQKQVILNLVNELNEAVPDLGLAYDETADSINMTTEELDNFLDSAAGQEEYNATVQRLSELYAEQTEIAARLEEAEASLANAQEEHFQEMPSYFDVAVDYNNAMNEGSAATSGLGSDVQALTFALEENEAQIAELEAAAESYSQQVEESTGNIAVMTATVEGLIAEMGSLNEAYYESYAEAYESITAELGLFNELDGTAKTSISDLISTLEGQVDYMETYAANIQKAMEMGVSEGLVQQLSDGKEESAQILAAIVEGGEDDIAALNAEFAKVEEGKETFSDTVAAMERDFDEKMGEIVERLSVAIDEMDLHDEAVEIAEYNIQGLIDGTSNPALRQALVDEYTAMANAALEAYKQAVGQASPSKEFANAAAYDVLGLIEGAEAKRANLAAAYEDLAKVAMESYANGVRNNLEAVAEAMAQFDAVLKDLGDFYNLKADVGDLEYQLWERTDGKNASDVEKYAKQLELLNAKQEDQQAIVQAAAEAYEAAVEQYGEGTAGSLEYQKALLEEQMALQDLLEEVEALTAAKRELAHQDALAQVQVAWENSGLGLASAAAINAGYTTPQQVAQIANIHLVTPDGKVLAEYIADPLTDYMDANGTPIIKK